MTNRSIRITLSRWLTTPVFRYSGSPTRGKSVNTTPPSIASIAKRADEVHFLKNGDFKADKNTRDDALLTIMVQVSVTERTQPQLIVLHLMEPHPQACNRTQGKYATFVQSKEMSCYLINIRWRKSMICSDSSILSFVIVETVFRSSISPVTS